MGRILLARAGTTDFDEQRRVVGALDLPLNLRGQAELTSLAEEIRDKDLVTIYSAADEASRQSAQLLGELLDVKVRVLADLKNLDYGLWQGLPLDEIRRKHPKLFRQWEESPSAVCPPAGEMLGDLVRRLPKSLRPVLKRRSKGMVLLIVPDTLRRIIRGYLRGDDLDALWRDDVDSLSEEIVFDDESLEERNR